MTIPTEMLQRIHNRDCIAGMESLPAASVDLAFADPPFNIGYDYDEYQDDRENSQYLDWCGRWIKQVYRLVKPTGSFWLAIGDEYAAELKLLSQQGGFQCRNWVVWYYTFGVNCRAKFSRSHAHLFHFVKDPARSTFRGDLLENRIPSARQLVYDDLRANPQGRLPDDTWILRPQDMADCFTASEDTWYFPRVAGTFKERAGFHGCQMPEQLLGRIIRVTSDENAVVLDPFTGSGTTLVVAKKLGRRFIGFELSKEYARRGGERLETVRLGDPLEGAAEPTMSAPATFSRAPGRKRQPETSASRSSDDEHLELFQREIEESQRAAALFRQQLVDAFSATCGEYSLDRVLADPALSEQLVDRCRRVGLIGEPRLWFARLLNYRKRGWLAHIPTSRRVEMGWSDCDGFVDASEISLARRLAEGFESIDELLCDPQATAVFDREAAALAPGHAKWEYRWAAIKLRKAAKLTRVRAPLLLPGRFSPAIAVSRLAAHEPPEASGVYVVRERGAATAIYVGQSLSLRRRLARAFDLSRPETRQLWQSLANLDELEVCWFLAEPRIPELLAYASHIASKQQARWNFPEMLIRQPSAKDRRRPPTSP